MSWASCGDVRLIVCVRTDFLLFLPTSAPGMRQVLSFYTSTSRVSAEGDVHMSDEAVSGLGTALAFLKSALFGAIIQIVETRPRPQQQLQYDTNNDDEYADATTPSLNDPTRPPFSPQDQNLHPEDADPHIPTKPARRKPHQPLEQAQEPLKLTDLVPDVGYFLAGGLSGITSRTATAPLDRLKVYLIAQTSNASQAVEAAKSGAAIKATRQGAKTLWIACRELWAAGGVRSLFAGTSEPQSSGDGSVVDADGFR